MGGGDAVREAPAIRAVAEQPAINRSKQLIRLLALALALP